MLRIASGTTDQFLYFNAGEIGLSSFTVYRSRNGAAAEVMTTPTINETDATNMPGVYELLLDEDMTIGAGNITEAMAFWISHAGMAPVYKEIELFVPVNADVAAILVDTAEIGAAGAGLTEAGGTGDHLTALATAAALQVVDDEVAALDTVADAVKAKTDQLAFGVTNTVNANITHVNEIEVTGDGETGTEWGPI
jgi:hypothetical protein